MLPPQLRSGTAVSKYRLTSSSVLRAASVAGLRASIGHAQSRSFFRGRRRCWDWTSQLDPTYHRFARIHTLKSRARLLKSLRRRGAFEWDVDSKPFFTPRNLRWASHWKGRQWYTNDDPKDKVKEAAAADEQRQDGEKDGYELSKREKEWKEQMEAMRKRIQQDPYEAIFGKRFEPFWSPLVPSWMREEMGLQGRPKEDGKDAKATADSATRRTGDQEVDRVQLKDVAARWRTELSKNKPSDELKTNMATALKAELVRARPEKPFSRMTREERRQHIEETASKQLAAESIQHPQTPRSNSYSYASSTTWDSVSNKTKKVEWDSTSNRTKTFEYDPISNRMVEIAPPNKVAIDSDSSAVRQMGSASKTTTPEPSKAVDIPVKQSNEVRKSIPIPPPLSQPSHSITLGYTQTSVGPLRSTAVSATAVKPAALAKLLQQDLDLLTADNVRASMGKVRATPSAEKSSTAEEKADLEHEFDVKARANDAEVDAILKERAAVQRSAEAPSAWDRAEVEDILRREVDKLNKKKEKLLNDERGLFHIERQKRELMKLEERLKALDERLKLANAAIVEEAKLPASQSALQTALQRQQSKSESPILQSSVERMQSKDLPVVSEHDLDDAAAHESTEPVDAQASVPKEWTKAADLLQADRVKRTSSKRAYPMTRWVDDMNARKVAYEHRKAEAKAAEDAQNAESNAKLEKLNKMLQAEVAEQKVRMHAFEGRYAQKVKSLRGELDIAFKQSSVHSQKHLERITELEAQVSGLKAKETKYADKVKSLRDELERAYKQSAVHAEKHLERIRSLENELQTATKASAPTATSQHEVMPAEGDICVNAPSFGDNGKWYKRPANLPDLAKAEIEQAEQKAFDEALVEEVQDIYEKEYGVIDENHQQRSKSQIRKTAKAEKKAEKRARRNERNEEKARQVVEVESDVDLGEELAKYEKENPEVYKAEESLFAAESTEKMKSVIADSLEQEVKVSEQEPQSIPVAAVEWTDPPLYKVLAYDSGNDMMSSATTTTSVLPGSAEERPLGVPEALSQLYQPARFVPYFAELQSENFQAIAATRDVIVFRQVKAREQTVSPDLGLEDHGLRGLQDRLSAAINSTGEQQPAEAGKGKSNRKVAASKDKDTNSQVNPIDGTSRRYMEPTTGNFASPTGFVNHDPVFPPNPKDDEQSQLNEFDHQLETQSDTYSTIAKEPTAKTSRQIWESLPGSSKMPVHREEAVFSGLTRKERQLYAKQQQWAAQERGRLKTLAKKENRVKENAEAAAQQKKADEEDPRMRVEAEQVEEAEQEDEQAARPSARRAGRQRRSSPSPGRRSSVLRYMLGAGAGAGGVAYLVASLAERERGLSDQTERTDADKARMEYMQQLQQQKKRLEDETARLTREWERR